MSDDTDILIAGAGIAGLTAAATFAASGYHVTLVDPAAPVESPESDGSDLRSTAFLQPAKALFERLGLWGVLAGHAAPLDALRVVDTHGDPPEIRTSRVFEASDISDQPFGWNLPNWLTRKALADTLKERGSVDLRFGLGIAGLVQRDAEALVQLSDGTRMSARLAVAADGRESALRTAAGIGVSTTRYGQKALAFTVSHPMPHDNVSTEIYHRGGAFTLVPLPDQAGRPASAVVWMNDGPKALATAAREGPAFDAEATRRSAAVLGPLTRTSPVRVWPVITQEARQLVAGRVALLAEAAHVLPPIGAQGLNTSLQDVSAMLRLLTGADDPGAPALLARYERSRSADISVRAAVIDLFNRLCRSGADPVQRLRSAGLEAVHDIVPLRRRIMSLGLGPRAEIDTLIRGT